MYLILLLIIVIVLLIYDRKNKQYWLEKGVYSPPSQFILGHLLNFWSSIKFWHTIDDYYKKGKKYGIIGIFEGFNPKLMVVDPNLIKHILVKDFDHFSSRRVLANSSSEDKIAKSMMVSVTGEKWKALRSATTPGFSSGKLKAMFVLIEKEAQNLKEFCKSVLLDGKSINMVELSGKYSLNVIQTWAFGMEGESFKENPTHAYYLIKNIFRMSFVDYAKIIMLIMAPRIFNFLGFHLTSPPQKKLHNYVKSIISERRQNFSPRRDFLSYMIDAEKEWKQMEDGSYVIDDDIIVGQAALFMIAGYDTVKTNLSFIMHNIAKYPKEQEKLREELRQIETEEGITYQNLQELHYLDAFIAETLRVFPVAFMLERMCTKEYKIPDTNVTIPKGMLVSVPTYSLHYDAAYWDEPEEFRPSRFLKENKSLINTYAYLPFGIGPRNCLGNRFALMEIKLVVAKLLLSFDITLKPGSDLKFVKSTIAYKPDEEHGVNINLIEI